MVSKRTVSGRCGIVMGDLQWICKVYRSGNGQGTRYRFQMNSWLVSILQRHVVDRAAWNSPPVLYVKAAGTSSRCAMCRGSITPELRRTVTCSKYGICVDRDVNAGADILARGLGMGDEDRAVLTGSTWFGTDWIADETMVAEPTFEIIRKADATRRMLVAGIPHTVGDRRVECQLCIRAYYLVKKCDRSPTSQSTGSDARI